MKVISLTFHNRPGYAARVLESLSMCQGSGDYNLVIHLDGPTDPIMLSLCERVAWAPCCIIREDRNLGCNQSTRAALETAFGMADYVVHVEEDVLLSPDALRYFEWGNEFRADPSVLTIGAWRQEPVPDLPSTETKAVKVACFHCWGWATWRDRWQEIAEHWTTGTDLSHSWDLAVDTFRRKAGRYEIAPLVSRSINIGAIGGVHRGDWLLPYWAGSDGFKHPDSYHFLSV